MSTNKKIPFINFKESGWAEMLIALLPILGAYYLGPVPFSFWILLLLSVVSIFRRKKIDKQMMKPLLVFFAYFFIHETILMVVADSFNINNRIEKTVFILSILFVVPLIDIKKLSVSLNIVSLICIIGLVYQYLIIFSGGTVHPLEIPGLDMVESRLLSETNRPSSFFMEPAAYAFYMYAPIVFSLIEKRYLWTAVLILSVLLSTSTTGLFAAFIILGVYIISQRQSKGRNLIVIAIAAVMLLSLTYTNFFDVGLNKLDDTDFETNVRIWQGPTIVRSMKFGEMIFGAPYGDIKDYVRDGRISMSLLYGDATDIYMSTIWQAIFGLGLVGLLLYLNIFYKIAKNCKDTRPLVFCLFVVMFTGSMYLGVNFAFSLIILYLMTKTQTEYHMFEAKTE